MGKIYRIWSTPRETSVVPPEKDSAKGKATTAPDGTPAGPDSVYSCTTAAMTHNQAIPPEFKAAIARAKQMAAGAGGRYKGYSATTAIRIASSMTPAMLAKVMRNWSASALSCPLLAYLQREQRRRRPCRLNRRR
jgi:hypothetical protein